MTETAKHTPGPWNVSESGLLTNQGQLAVLAGDDRVCLVDAPEAVHTKPKDQWRIDSPTRSANAKLIAAAPDMFDALEQSQAWLERIIAQASGGSDMSDIDYARNFNAVLDRIHDALSKAGD